MDNAFEIEPQALAAMMKFPEQKLFLIDCR